ncbi:MAG: nuclear transport factor 2 family protein [Lysobacteraceae bacterium]
MKLLSIFFACLPIVAYPFAAYAGPGQAVSEQAALEQEAPEHAADPLFDTISALDTEVFAAFNICSDPAQLEKHAGYFAPDVEFYHDTGGVTWTRDAMIANTRQYVCGHFRRELIPGTLEVFPVKDFGAIARGSHRFCQFDSGRCEGMADFTVVWRLKDGKWTITRVLSYAHHATP